jgi:hypothetical protein
LYFFFHASFLDSDVRIIREIREKRARTEDLKLFITSRG